MTIFEEGIKFSAGKNIFYNPNMKFCRSMSSLAVGAIKDKLEVCDGFCASGIRGIRYAKENPNVDKLLFVDIEPEAIKNAKANARKNKLKHTAMQGNISKLVFGIVADFLEIDPFGSPAPYLYDSFRVFNPLKQAYLSVTATDVAVLCGGKTKACLKNYHSIPLNNEFTHETGLRILVKKIAETAAEFNMGIYPLVSFSNRHYLKTILHVKRGADLAHKSMTSLGYIYHCNSCGYRAADVFPSKCPKCKKTTDFTGPIWLGELQDRKFIKKMKTLNSKRDYSDKAEIETMLDLLYDEVGLPPFYYNIHNLCRKFSIGRIPTMEKLLEKLRKKGYKAARTHYSKLSIKTNASLAVLRGVLK